MRTRRNGNWRRLGASFFSCHDAASRFSSLMLRAASPRHYHGRHDRFRAAGRRGRGRYDQEEERRRGLGKAHPRRDRRRHRRRARRCLPPAALRDGVALGRDRGAACGGLSDRQRPPPLQRMVAVVRPRPQCDLHFHRARRRCRPDHELGQQEPPARHRQDGDHHAVARQRGRLGDRLRAAGEPLPSIKLEPSGTGSKVTWDFSSDLGFNPVLRYFGLGFDKMVGPDYEAGLAKLKAVAETPAAPGGT